MYDCKRCGKTVTVCRRCDHGNIYCAQGCAEASRQESVRDAGEKYQETARGKDNHAARQQRYLERQESRRAKMTHQGSAATSAPVSSGLTVSAEAQTPRPGLEVHDAALEDDRTRDADVGACVFG